MKFRLPCVSLGDFEKLLDFAFRPQDSIGQEYLLKMLILTNYFQCQHLVDVCCSEFRHYITPITCTRVLLFAGHFQILKLRTQTLLYIVDHLPEIEKDDLSALPVDFLLEIIQHPAAVINQNHDSMYDPVEDKTMYDPVENEHQLLCLALCKINTLEHHQKSELIPKFLKAVHLPLMSLTFLNSLQEQLDEFAGTSDLITEAIKTIHVLEYREWYLPRYKEKKYLKMSSQENAINVNGKRSNHYSPCFLLNGIPFFVYGFSENGENIFTIESPLLKLNLPYDFEVIAIISGGNHARYQYFSGDIVKSWGAIPDFNQVIGVLTRARIY